MSSAIYGLIGVVVGAFLGWFREMWSARRTRERSARYLAIRVVCVLDKYVERCAEVVCDNGDEDRDGVLVAKVSHPSPPEFPADLDWRSVDHALMYRLLSLPNEAETAERYIEGAGDNATPPDYDEWYEERKVQYSKVGLIAFALTEDLRKKFGIPAQEFGYWNPAERLVDAKMKADRRREERAKHMLPFPPPPPPVAETA